LLLKNNQLISGVWVQNSESLEVFWNYQTSIMEIFRGSEIVFLYGLDS